MELVESLEPARSPAETGEHDRREVVVGAVQASWSSDPEDHTDRLRSGIAIAADRGAEIVCLPELTLTRYFASDPGGVAGGVAEPEDLETGPTLDFARGAAGDFGVAVHASLFERVEGPDGLGFNTAIVVTPNGDIASRTRKLHIPITSGYHEDRFFRPGPADEDPFPTLSVGKGRFGFPTCWDQWFPELARIYSLRGTEVLVYPTAIGSEPDHPDFDTAPLWESVIRGNGIANGLFMVAINRHGDEGDIRFYGSSFISDPYGRILVKAPRDLDCALVASLELSQREDWLDLFPFIGTRRPDAYQDLVAR